MPASLLSFPLGQMMSDDVFPFLLGALVFLIPIIAILTNHQQKMAKLLRPDLNPNAVPTVNPETQALRAEVADLKHRIDSLTLSIEQMRDEQRTGREIESRLRA